MDLSKVLEKELLEGRFWTHSRTLVDGCTKVSPGCRNCWAEAMQMRFNNGMLFNGDVVLHPDRLNDILPKAANRAPRVWTYWNDLFHEEVGWLFVKMLFEVISQSTDFHIICTKRPDVAVQVLNDIVVVDNVLLLVTMEDFQRVYMRSQPAADLQAMGWKVGILVEPMLTIIDLQKLAFIPDWIICGPETGKGKRPFDPGIAMHLQQQAAAAEIPFFYKAGLLNGKRYLETP